MFGYRYGLIFLALSQGAIFGCVPVEGGVDVCIEDACGVCDTDPTNDCVEDCAGVFGGVATLDQ